MKNSKMVKFVTPKEMDGDTDLEKILNAYLTKQFILSRDVPSDECLSEAKEILKIIEEYVFKNGYNSL